MISVSSMMRTPMERRNACVSASVLLISSEKICGEERGRKNRGKKAEMGATEAAWRGCGGAGAPSKHVATKDELSAREVAPGVEAACVAARQHGNEVEGSVRWTASQKAQRQGAATAYANRRCASCRTRALREAPLPAPATGATQALRQRQERSKRCGSNSSLGSPLRPWE
jgi:hypothetical protein